MGNWGNSQKLIPIQFPSLRRFLNFHSILDILVIKGQNPTLPKMADLHPLKACNLKTMMNTRNRLDDGKSIGISYWLPPLMPMWYWTSKLQAGVLAILTTPLTIISLLLYSRLAQVVTCQTRCCYVWNQIYPFGPTGWFMSHSVRLRGSYESPR